MGSLFTVYLLVSRRGKVKKPCGATATKPNHADTTFQGLNINQKRSLTINFALNILLMNEVKKRKAYFPKYIYFLHMEGDGEKVGDGAGEGAKFGGHKN